MTEMEFEPSRIKASSSRPSKLVVIRMSAAMVDLVGASHLFRGRGRSLVKRSPALCDPLTACRPWVDPKASPTSRSMPQSGSLQSIRTRSTESRVSGLCGYISTGRSSESLSKASLIKAAHSTAPWSIVS
jgi:hypothetical protein